MTAQNSPVHWFSEADVDALLSPAVLIESLEKAFLAVADGRIVEKDASTLREELLGANYVTYSALWKEAGLATVKVLTAVDSNGTRDLPLIDSIVVAIDAASGKIRGILDGNRITARRTAAVSAIAVRYLARTKQSVLGIIGTGVQAIAHAEAMLIVGDFSRILIASAAGDEARARRAAAEIERRTSRNVEPTEVINVASSADVLACCSLSRTPLFNARNLRPNATVVCVSRFAPDAAEFDPKIIEDAAIVVADSADRLSARWTVRPAWMSTLRDLSDVMSVHQIIPERGQRIFLSGGRAFEDLVAAKLVLEAAEPRKLGQMLL